jgi:hypothetical protein
VTWCCAVQDARRLPLERVDTPFAAEARRAGATEKFPFMPEDDIAVVVNYVLPA